MMNNNFSLSQGNNSTGSNMKYKTILCKHYDTSKGCVYKDKCQFAHGLHELRSGAGFSSGNNFSNSGSRDGFQKNDEGMGSMGSMGGQSQKKVPNPANFKIVKCKNFEKEGQCKYGNTCTFAHGETDLRTKSENIMAPNLGNNMMMNPMMCQPYMMDPNLLFYMQNQMGYPANSDPNLMPQGGNFGSVDPNALNLNTNATPSTNGTMFNDMGQSFNMNSMGMYQMYPGQNNMN